MADKPEFESAISDEMRAQVGVDGPASHYEVTTTSVRMFARAVGYEDPVYFDREEAHRRGYRDLPAPPAYLGSVIFQPGYDPTFGTPRGQGRGIQSPYTLTLNGGTDVEYFDEDICAGDELTATSKLESLTERYSQALGGPMLITISATIYRNQLDTVVAIARNTGITYGPRRED